MIEYVLIFLRSLSRLVILLSLSLTCCLKFLVSFNRVSKEYVILGIYASLSLLKVHWSKVRRALSRLRSSELSLIGLSYDILSYVFLLISAAESLLGGLKLLLLSEDTPTLLPYLSTPPVDVSFLVSFMLIVAVSSLLGT